MIEVTGSVVLPNLNGEMINIDEKEGDVIIKDGVIQN